MMFNPYDEIYIMYYEVGPNFLKKKKKDEEEEQQEQKVNQAVDQKEIDQKSLDKAIAKAERKRAIKRTLGKAALITGAAAGAYVYHDNKKFKKKKENAIAGAKKAGYSKIGSIKKNYGGQKQAAASEYRTYASDISSRADAAKLKRKTELEAELRKEIIDNARKKSGRLRIPEDYVQRGVDKLLPQRMTNDPKIKQIESKRDSLIKGKKLAARDTINSLNSKRDSEINDVINTTKGRVKRVNGINYLDYKKNQYKSFKASGKTAKDLIPTPKKIAKKAIDSATSKVADAVVYRMPKPIQAAHYRRQHANKGNK